MESSSLSWSSPRSARLVLALISTAALYIITFVCTSRQASFSHAATSRVTLSHTTNPDQQSSESSENGPEFKTTAADFGRVYNRTLGFETVIAVGLPTRSDKRDALDLMAALSGFDLTWVNDIEPSSISDKAIPFGINLDKIHDNFLGSWRGHMDAIRQIVASGVSSALILEDDVDWDVYLRHQLSDIAHGARRILGSSSPLPNSPYGDSWDIIWLGHCGEPFPEILVENLGLEDDLKAKISVKFTIKHDDTVPPYSQVSRLVDWSAYPAHTRLVHMTAAPICSFAYAISQSAARRILYALSVDGLHMAFDNSLAQLFRDAIYDLGRQKEGGYRLKCLSVNPTIMFHHKARGRTVRDSDIHSHGQHGDVRERGMSESIKWSMRLNLENILEDRVLKPQFRDEET